MGNCLRLGIQWQQGYDAGLEDSIKHNVHSGESMGKWNSNPKIDWAREWITGYEEGIKEGNNRKEMARALAV